MTLRLSVLCATTVALLALTPVPAGAQSQEHDAPGRRGAPPPSSAPAAPANLCAALARAAADGANKFRSFQTGRFHDETKEWDSSLMLPGFRFCRVDIELANLNCWTERMTPLEAEPRALEFKRAVQACYPGLVPGEDVERASTAVRSKTTWTLPAGRRVRLVKRIRTDGQPASIFIYVE